MKTASVRELQHHFSKVLRAVEHGQEIRITRRNRVVARLVPDGEGPKTVSWSHVRERLKKIKGKIKGPSLTEILLKERDRS